MVQVYPASKERVMAANKFLCHVADEIETITGGLIVGGFSCSCQVSLVIDDLDVTIIYNSFYNVFQVSCAGGSCICVYVEDETSVRKAAYEFLAALEDAKRGL